MKGKIFELFFFPFLFGKNGMRLDYRTNGTQCEHGAVYGCTDSPPHTPLLLLWGPRSASVDDSSFNHLFR